MTCPKSMFTSPSLVTLNDFISPIWSPGVRDDVEVGQDRRAVDRDVEHALPDLARSVVLVDEVQPDLDVRPVGDREVPRHLRDRRPDPTARWRTRRRASWPERSRSACRSSPSRRCCCRCCATGCRSPGRPTSRDRSRSRRSSVPPRSRDTGTAWPLRSTASAAGCRAFPEASSRRRSGASSLPRAGTCRSGCGSRGPASSCHGPPTDRLGVARNANTPDAAVTGRVPSERHAVLRVERPDPGPGDGAGGCHVAHDVVVEPAHVPTHVDRGAGDRHLRVGVATRVVDPRRVQVRAGRARLPAARRVAEGRREVAGARRDGDEVRAVRRELDVSHVGVEGARARAREIVRLPVRHGRGASSTG